MLDAIFWWTGVAIWAGLVLGTVSYWLIDVHDKSIRGHPPIKQR